MSDILTSDMSKNVAVEKFEHARRPRPLRGPQQARHEGRVEFLVGVFRDVEFKAE